jgi:hypothetical protein
MKKQDPVEAGIRGLGADPHADPVQRVEQLRSLRSDFEARRLNGEAVWHEYPDPAAAGFHPEIHPELGKAVV